MANSNGNHEVVVKSDCEYIEKEVDMGFHKDFFAEGKDGVYNKLMNAGCQRISRCSCDCNRCTLLD